MGEYLRGSTINYTSEGLAVVGNSIASPDHPLRNEDTMLFMPDDNIAMILDGSSGSLDGQAASRAAADFLVGSLHNQSSKLPQVRRGINKSLREASKYVEEVTGGSRTTAVLVKIIDTNSGRVAVFGSVGDSRGYIVRDEHLQPVTVEHSLVDASTYSPRQKKSITSIIDNLLTEDQLKSLKRNDPLANRFFWRRNWVVQILGHEGSILPAFFDSETTFHDFPIVMPKIYTVYVEEGQKIVLTSDGVHDNLAISEMEKIVTASSRDLSKRLTYRAFEKSEEEDNPRATDDDTSAIVITIK